MIDIGVNLSSRRFKGHIGDVLTRAREADVRQLVLTGTSVDESRAVLSICEEYRDQFPAMLFATCGIHPHDASSYNNQSLHALRELAQHPQMVAIGETGLDFNRNLSPTRAQEACFEAQLELAAELQLPLFLHERDAAVRQLEMLKSYRDEFADAVIHCFTGDKKNPVRLFGYGSAYRHNRLDMRRAQRLGITESGEKYSPATADDRDGCTLFAAQNHTAQAQGSTQ
jgi:TatD DNase family protein